MELHKYNTYLFQIKSSFQIKPSLCAKPQGYPVSVINQRFYDLVVRKFQVFFVLVILLVQAPGVLAQNADKEGAEFIVFPYIKDVTDNSFTILWETSTAVRGEIYLAGTAYTVLKPTLKMVAAETEQVRFHKLEVNGLQPGELYYYQVANLSASGDTLKGPVTPVTIPNYDHSAIAFTVVGDTQGNPVVWERIARLMFEETPQFVVHCGDLVQYGPHKDDWVDEFFGPANNLLRHIPLYPAIGNHEMNNEKFYQYFDLPDDEAFFSVSKGSLRIIFIDTNKDILPGSKQYRKLEKLLASADERWKMVVHHHPVFTSDYSAYRSSLMSKPMKGDPNTLHLKNLYETYGVDLSLAGHIHGYERSWPIQSNRIQEDQGVVHIITGGGGGGLRAMSSFKNWFSVETKKKHHYLNIRIWQDKLWVEAVDTTGLVFDTWEKQKYPVKTKLKPPLIEIPQSYFIDNTRITIKNTNKTGNIHYREHSGRHRPGFEQETSWVVDQTTTVSALVSDGQNKESREVVKTVTKLPLLKKQKTVTKSMTADYHEGYFTVLPAFDKLKPTKTFSVDSISLAGIKPRLEDHFAVRFKGSIMIPETDVYRFLLESFDGSMLIIDDQVLIDNDGVHYEIFRDGYAALEKGPHSIEVRYFDYKRRETLRLKMGKQTGEMVDINRYIYRKNKK